MLLASSKSLPKGPVKRIDSLLVIDDNPEDVEFCKIIAERSGRYNYVFSAADGQEAIELFRDYEESQKAHSRHFPPQVILLDINMPRMTGYEFMEAFERMRDEIRRQGREPAIVMVLSSSNDPQDRARVSEFKKVNHYWVKPLTIELAIQIAEEFGSESSD